MSEKPDAWWVESAEAKGVIQDPCLVDAIVLPGILIYRTTPQAALLKNERYKIHKAVPDHRIHQQCHRSTRKNDIISLFRQCRMPPAVNALGTGVSVTVYTILRMETATPGVIVLFSLAPLRFVMQGENNDTTGLLSAQGPGKSEEELNLRKKLLI